MLEKDYQKGLIKRLEAAFPGCKVIKKYIDPDIQQKEIEAGLAPTPETVIDFCGEADMVEADQYKTKFVNPSKTPTLHLSDCHLHPNRFRRHHPPNQIPDCNIRQLCKHTRHPCKLQ